MAASQRTRGFWSFQAIFWTIAGAALFISGATQMPVAQAFVRNLYLLFAGFMSSFFLAMMIDQLRGLALIRVRLVSYSLAYFIALFCVVVINAISFTQQGVGYADLTFGQWFSGTMNFALVYAFWSELFIQRIYVDEAQGAPGQQRPDRLVVEHRGEMVPLPLADVSSITAAGDYVEIHAAERKYLYRQTLQALEESLASGDFLRVHRSALVNVPLVESVGPLGKGRYQLHFRDGSVATTSRGYREVVEKTFLASAV